MKKLLTSLLIGLLLLLSVKDNFAQLVQVTSFGSNPGNLAMYRYVPANMPANAPIVVAMHGCTQDATTYFNETGWKKLADTYKFYLVFPQQNSGNNSSKCFNWFESGDITKGQGEALSIKQMTDNMKTNYSVDNNRVFVTGLSAGGAMTTVMCATYPEIFKGGAVMAGIPYKAAIGTTAAFQALSPGIDKTPAQWGDLVRQQNTSFSGNWPKMAVFHGTSDNTVRPMNLIEVAEQWANVNGIDVTADITNTNFDGVTGITRKVYNNASNQPLVITYDITGMGHAITVDPGTGVKQGGATGGYSVDKNFWSSYWAADFWGLLNTQPGTLPTAPSNLTANSISSSQINLTWTDNATDETGYIVESSTTSGSGFTVIANLAANTTSYSNTGLSASTAYYYRISANNATGNSAYSNQATATTQVPPSGTPPAAPTNLTASATGSTKINLTWTDNATDETGYIIESSTTSGSGFTVIANLTANTTSYSNTGLNASTTYFYRVQATNASGNSAYSNQASATTQATSTSTYTIEQLSGSTFITILASDNTGQSFTTVQAGEITTIEVKLKQATTGSILKIFSGNTVSGTPLYQQSGLNLGSGWQTITLSTPFAVNASQQYTFQVTRASILYNVTNSLSGGNFWYNSISYTTFDAVFKLTISTSGASLLAADPIITNTLNADVVAYPNPSVERISINFGETIHAGDIYLYDSKGNLLRTNRIENENQWLWDISSLNNGLYFVKIITKDKNSVLRVFKE